MADPRGTPGTRPFVGSNSFIFVQFSAKSRSAHLLWELVRCLPIRKILDPPLPCPTCSKLERQTFGVQLKYLLLFLECILKHGGLWRQCIRYECDPAAYTCYTTVSEVAGDGKDPDAPELEREYPTGGSFF